MAIIIMYLTEITSKSSKFKENNFLVYKMTDRADIFDPMSDFLLVTVL